MVRREGRRTGGGGLPKCVAALLVLLAALWAPAAARAQWTSSSGSTTTPDNVRIGNNSAPTNNLDVKSDTAPVGVFLSGHGRALINFHDAAAPQDAKMFQWRAEGGVFRMTSVNDAWNNYVNGNIITATAAGNVGVGTATPSDRLSVYTTKASTQTSAPDSINLGGTYSSAAGANLKLKLYDDSVSAGGFGVSLNQLDYNVWGSAASHVFYQGTTELMRIKGSGTVGIGTATPNASYKLDVNGGANVTGNLTTTGTLTAGVIEAKYQDVAEWVPSTQKLPAGTVVILDPARSNHVLASAIAYDTSVAGVISAQPGLILGEGGEGKVKVATTGRVRVKVDATKGAIRIGDLLVTSGVAGVAMRSEAVSVGGVTIHRPGTIIGKALEPLAGGVGEILVLLSMQ